MKSIRHARKASVGATAVEYALVIAFIAAVIFGAVAAFGGAVAGLYVLSF